MKKLFVIVLFCACYLLSNAQGFSKSGDSYKISGVPATEKTNLKNFERLMASYKVYQNFLETNTNINVKFVSGNVVPYGKTSKDGRFQPFSSKKSLRLAKKDIEKCIETAGNDIVRTYMQWNWFMVQKPYQLKEKDKQMIDILAVKINRNLL